MLLDEVADLGAQADTTSSVVEDHSWQLGELSVMMQTVQEMMGAQQEQLMQLREELWEWQEWLMAREQMVNNQLIWLQSWVEVMDVGEEAEGETLGEEEETMTMEVDEGVQWSWTRIWMTSGLWSPNWCRRGGV